MSDADRELAEQLVGERWTPLVAHLVLFALLLVLVWGQIPHRLTFLWGGAIIGISTLRPVVWGYARHRRVTPGTLVVVVRVTMLALGLAWGIGGALAIRLLPTADAGLVLLGLTGLLAGGLATLVADAWTFPIYSLAMFVPLVIMVGMVGPRMFDELAVILMIIFILFTSRLHYRSHQALRNQLRVENELRNRERQLAAAQEIAHVGSWEWDIPTNVVTWSDELRRMYGVGPDTAAGYAEFLARAHPEDRARLEAMVVRALADRQPVDYEWRCLRPSGEVRYIQGRNIVETNAAGEAVRMAGTSLDITDRKRAEDEIKVLRGILPICASCKRIRGDNGTWEAVESYVREHTDAEFSHGLCPDCAARDWGATTS
jgi:PAS domain S-box-containing protein